VTTAEEGFTTQAFFREQGVDSEKFGLEKDLERHRLGGAAKTSL
jgi:hypothetical protein